MQAYIPVIEEGHNESSSPTLTSNAVEQTSSCDESLTASQVKLQMDLVRESLEQRLTAAENTAADARSGSKLSSLRSSPRLRMHKFASMPSRIRTSPYASKLSTAPTPASSSAQRGVQSDVSCAWSNNIFGTVLGLIQSLLTKHEVRAALDLIRQIMASKVVSDKTCTRQVLEREIDQFVQKQSATSFSERTSLLEDMTKFLSSVASVPQTKKTVAFPQPSPIASVSAKSPRKANAKDNIDGRTDAKLAMGMSGVEAKVGRTAPEVHEKLKDIESEGSDPDFGELNALAQTLMTKAGIKPTKETVESDKEVDTLTFGSTNDVLGQLGKRISQCIGPAQKAFTNNPADVSTKEQAPSNAEAMSKKVVVRTPRTVPIEQLNFLLDDDTFCSPIDRGQADVEPNKASIPMDAIGSDAASGNEAQQSSTKADLVGGCLSPDMGQWTAQAREAAARTLT